MSGTLWLSILSTLAAALFAALDRATRTYSTSRILQKLRDDAERERFQRYLERREAMLRTTAVLSGGFTVLAILATAAACLGAEPTLADHIEAYAVAFAVVIVAGNLLPGALGEALADALAPRTLPALTTLNLALWPLTSLIRLLETMLLRLVGAPPTPQAAQLVDEIRDAVELGRRRGLLGEEAAEMVESIFEFRDTDVADIMTPRTDVFMLPATTPLAEALPELAEKPHSRVPIYGKDRDDVVGVLHTRELVRYLANGQSPPERPSSLQEIARKPFFVPKTKRVEELLHDLREARENMAVVLDEYGGCAGVVTIEDILEEIVGEIHDEYEDEAPEPVVTHEDGSVEVDARTHVDDLAVAIGAPIVTDDQAVDTVGGLVFAALGRIPDAGENLTLGGLQFTVLDADPRRINRLRVQVQSPDGEP